MEIKEKTTKKKKEGAAKKPPTPQISVTFKRNSPIEMALYEHLQSKFYQGAYIKELLITQMLRERPDLVERFSLNTYLDTVEQQKPPIIDTTATFNPSTGETTFNDEPEPLEEIAAPEPKSELSGGLLATLGEFISIE